MRISDWSSDVCSSDLETCRYRAATFSCRTFPAGPARTAVLRSSAPGLKRHRAAALPNPPCPLATPIPLDPVVPAGATQQGVCSLTLSCILGLASVLTPQPATSLCLRPLVYLAATAPPTGGPTN